MKNIAILLLLVFICCKDKNDRLSVNEFDQIRTIVPLQADTIFLDNSVDVVNIAANEKFVFVLGEDSSAVYRFTVDSLKLDKVFNLHGRGPGEIYNPTSIAVSNDRVLISDRDDLNIQIYDTALVFIESIKVNGLVNSLDVFKNELFIVSFVELGQSRIQIYDSKLLKTFTIPAESDHPLDVIGVAEFINQDSFIFLRRYTNEGYVVDIASGEIDPFSNPYLPIKAETEEKMGVLIPSFQLVTQVTHHNDGLYVASGTILEDGQPFFRYNKKGKLERIWLMEPDQQVISIAVFGQHLFGYSFVNNTLSKYEL